MRTESRGKSGVRVELEQASLMHVLAIVWVVVWTKIIPALGIALSVACISLCRSLRQWNRPT